MDRLKIIEKLQELEKRKQAFSGLKNDVNNVYCRSTTINAKLDTSSYDYNRKYKNQDIKINVKLFSSYINEELKIIEEEINELINDLKGE